MMSGDMLTRRADLAKALRRGFGAAYENMGYVVFVSFLSFSLAVLCAWVLGRIASLIRLGLTEIVLVIPGGMVIWLVSVGVFHYAKKVVYYEYPGLVDTITGVGVLFSPAVRLFAIDLLVTMLLVGDTVALFLRRGSVVWQLTGIVCGYLSVIWLMSCMYHLPLLVKQLEMESGPRPVVVLRKSFLLMADNPGFTVGLFVVIIALAVVCALPGFVGMALFYPGGTAFIITHALRELFIKYGIVEEEPEVVEDRGWPQTD
ncbi:MAG: hypothetical protein ACUVRS_09420 [Armatimonadota bacterium]